MLDSETKNRIDSARNMLVGKVPDPKSQVEQITIAMIYKFMDDMDAEAEELGGKRTFFAGDYAKFGWAKLMRTGLAGHEMLALYSDAISSMTENPGLPPLFRDIFKNAYLPYRDPETLRAFLKIINEFTYDHSEKLGDAFEYLLSVLGSQGDAGQFRTPRHIIDFMVEVLAPKKGEVILDPACGTAGFLISAYKHILRNNTDPNGNSMLTPDEKGRLANNFKGYDISPDMVRLSLVNLYLHGFKDPHIFEYDTLTSEDRWNEFADVILANPPFMSPKGGIKPHKRFSIQAKRSEVLFLDYMAEHLTPTGRAAIIVPEGIIFTNQVAYKELRKMLVENSLVAVISLPAGCFNPYSPVKTSILILDKSISKASNSIAFFKVENDGFGLGAQRRAIEKNDLPQVQAELDRYLQAIRENTDLATLELACGQVVPKAKLAANGDYNLSGEKYREGATKSTHFPWKTVESLVETVTPPSKIQKSAFGKAGRFPIIDQSQDDIAGWTDDEAILIHPSKPLVIFGDHTCAIKMIEIPFAQGADGIKILKTIDELEPRYLFHVLRAKPLESDGYQRHYSKLKEHQIPLPPLDVQKEIVAEIEGYQKVINGARAVLDNYRPHISVKAEWPVVALAQLCEIEHGYAFKGESFVEEGQEHLPILLTPGNFVQGGGIYFTKKNTKRYSSNFPEAFRLKRGDLVVVMTDLSPMMKILGMPAIIDRDDFLHNQRIGKVVLKSKDVTKAFLRYAFLIQEVNGQIKREATGATVKHTSPTRILSVKIPLPSLTMQQAIVAEIEAEQALVAANKELIVRFEKKIQDTLARVWGSDLINE